MSDMANILERVYEAQDGNPQIESYCDRHGVKSASILRPRIEGKTVIEIGGGIGLLAMHMGLIAKRVYCIEANPMWSWVFAGTLLKLKPKNVSFLFGAADEFESIKGDVAVICTHSGINEMRHAASKFAPTVIDVYGELISENPEAFDKTAVWLRNLSATPRDRMGDVDSK